MDELKVADRGGEPKDQLVEEEDDGVVPERLCMRTDRCQAVVEIDEPFTDVQRTVDRTGVVALVVRRSERCPFGRVCIRSKCSVDAVDGPAIAELSPRPVAAGSFVETSDEVFVAQVGAGNREALLEDGICEEDGGQRRIGVLVSHMTHVPAKDRRLHGGGR